MEADTRKITITTPYGGACNTNYNSHMEFDTRKIAITTPIWRWIQYKLQLPYGV